MPRAGALMYKREHSKVEQKSRGKYLTCARKTRPSQKLEGGDMLGARGAGAQGRRYMCTGELRRCNAGLQNKQGIKAAAAAWRRGGVVGHTYT